MSRQLLIPSILAVAAMTVAGCSSLAPEPGNSAVQATPEAGKPAADATVEPGTSVVFEVNPDNPHVKLDPPSVRLSGTPVITVYKDPGEYTYYLELHDGPAGTKFTCADYDAELKKSTVLVTIIGKSSEGPKDLKTLTDAQGSIDVKSPVRGRSGAAGCRVSP